MEDVYTTVSKNATAHYRDRGSKFLGYVFSVTSSDQANNCLQLVKEEHPSATHHCFAWRLGIKGEHYRAYDDGEPSGTAGRPIYDAIRSAGITNVLVVVVRYFGGTQLGKPGLIQAYKETTIAVIAAAGTEQKAVTILANCKFDYEWMNVVMTELKKVEAKILTMDSASQVEMKFELRLSLFETIQAALLEKTRQQIKFF